MSYFRFAHALRFPVNDIGMVFFIGLITEEVEAVMPGGARCIAGDGRCCRSSPRAWRCAGRDSRVSPVSAVALRIHAPGRLACRCCAGRRVRVFHREAIFTSREGPIAFLLLIAVVSDALGVVSIAIWFPAADGYPAALGLMAVAVLSRRGCAPLESIGFGRTLITGAVMARMLLGGISPALALVPIVPFLPHRPRGLYLFVEAPPTAPRRFEHVFRYPVRLVLLFCGLVNGGVVLAGDTPGAWAVLIAALIGRPIGILVSVALAMAAGLRLADLRWRELIVVSLAASAGFTFALFFATAIMPAGPLLGELKLGALSTCRRRRGGVGGARLLRVGRFTATQAGKPTRRLARLHM